MQQLPYRWYSGARRSRSVHYEYRLSNTNTLVVVEKQPSANPVVTNAELMRIQFERATRTPNKNKKEVCDQQSFGAVHNVQSKDGLIYLYRFFMALGVLMPEKNKVLYCFYALLPLCILTLYLPAAFVISYCLLDYSNINIGNLFTSIQVGIASGVGAIKLWILAFRLPKLRTTEEIMTKLDARCTEDDEIDELRKMASLGNRVFIYVLICNVTYATSTFLAAVVKGRPPYNLYNPLLNWRNSRWELVLESLWEWLLVDGLSCIEATTDSYAALYVCIIRAHMKTLLIRIEKLGSNPESTLQQNYEKLKMCIKDHKLLLKLFDIVHSVVSTTYFVQFMTTSLLLGVTLLNVMLFAVDDSARIGHVALLLALIMEIYPLCYYGQSLLDDSNLLAATIFHCNWIEQSAEFRKMLVLFTQHTQKPMELFAGKLMPINLTTFVSIAKFSFTLYSFINNMGVKERFETLSATGN
ncbi:odorant receptor 7a-like [Eurosta solidaginis]|uniref:odorant receptor 7a-like n=1 Tax=Eurosta solidaginis TaxID=178769 RepID=UPI003530AED4